MKLLSTIVFAAAALATSAVSAAQYSSDQERRDQNREQALASWRAANPSMANSATGRSDARGDGRRTTVREKARNGASSVRNFTHRQAEKARNFSERQDRRYGNKRTTINTSPEGGGK